MKAVANGASSRVGLFAGVALGLILLALLTWFLFVRDSTPATVPMLERAPAVAGVACDRNPALTLNGSDVLGRTLVPELVEAWLKENGAETVTRSQRGSTTTITGRQNGKNCLIIVEGPNTTDGLNALMEGNTDIAMSARQLTGDEIARLKPLGDMISSKAEHVVAIDALSVIVHPQNAVPQLTKGELADIIAGRVSAWQGVGGPSGRINLYIGSSGVRAADTARELLGSPGASAKTSSSDAGVLEAVARDPLGLGIVSYPAPVGVRTVPMGEQGATAFTPSGDTIATQSYPLTRRLYFYADPSPSNPNTTSFLSFVQGREGQALVAQAGYGGQNVQVFKAPVIREGASFEYRELVAGARQLNIAFRFRTGAAELDNKALEDGDRLLDFLDLQGNREPPSLMLIGFADAQGAEEGNVQLSRQRAEAVASALKARGIEVATVRWFGEEQPVGDNSTEAGRERNRRVEVWVIE